MNGTNEESSRNTGEGRPVRNRHAPQYLQDYVWEGVQRGAFHVDETFSNDDIDNDNVNVTFNSIRKELGIAHVSDVETGVLPPDKASVVASDSVSEKSVISSLSHVSVLSAKHNVKLKVHRHKARLNELLTRDQEDKNVDKLLNTAQDKAYEAQLNAQEIISKARIDAQFVDRKVKQEKEKIQTDLCRQREIRDIQNKLVEMKLVEEMIESELGKMPCGVKNDTTNEHIPKPVDTQPRHYQNTQSVPVKHVQHTYDNKSVPYAHDTMHTETTSSYAHPSHDISYDTRAYSNYVPLNHKYVVRSHDTKQTDSFASRMYDTPHDPRPESSFVPRHHITSYDTYVPSRHVTRHEPNPSGNYVPSRYMTSHDIHTSGYVPPVNDTNQIGGNVPSAHASLHYPNTQLRTHSSFLPDNVQPPTRGVPVRPDITPDPHQYRDNVRPVNNVVQPTHMTYTSNHNNVDVVKPDYRSQFATPQNVPLGMAPNMSELLVASSFGIPKPTLPTFSSGKERDFAVLKMAFDTLIDCHAHLSQQYKYQLLLGKLGGAPKRLAESFLYDATPYMTAMRALKHTYGHPRQLVQSELAAIMNTPPVKMNDFESFEHLSLSVNTLVGMLKSVEGDDSVELRCGSHVDRLLAKLPPSSRDSFVEHCLNRGILSSATSSTYNLQHFDSWLTAKTHARKISHHAVKQYHTAKPVSQERPSAKRIQSDVPTAVFNSTTSKPKYTTDHKSLKHGSESHGYCAYCNLQHHLSACSEFNKLSDADIIKWVEEKRRCWRCGRSHLAKNCNLSKPCLKCKRLHLTILHGANEKVNETRNETLVKVKQLFIDQPVRPASVILKVVPIIVHSDHGESMKTHAILDDGSMRTMVLPSVVEELDLPRTSDSIRLSTVRRGGFDCHGHSVSFNISPVDSPDERFEIHNAFTSDSIALSEYTYHVDSLQEQFPHLLNADLPPIDHVSPTILIGSDHANLILPVKPVMFGPPGTPSAVCTKLGWSVQGPSETHVSQTLDCLTTQVTPINNTLMNHVEKLWQMDILPFAGKHVTRSKEDHHAVNMLEEKTTQVEVHDEIHYATPLLRKGKDLDMHAGKEAVMANFKRVQKHHLQRPEVSEIHNQEILKLVNSGYVREISDEEAENSNESWFIPHHVVNHNGKSRLVFNCSYEYKGQCLNRKLLTGPTLGSTLLGVLLRFRRYQIAISGDIKAMFHQIRLLPEDQPLLRFIWQKPDAPDIEPVIYQWQVLPFGTTCSPCCATFALMKHALTYQDDFPNVATCVKEAFYVDNCLDSLTNVNDARHLVITLRDILAKGGFNIRQWACNVPEVLQDLPPEAKSSSFELWTKLDQHEVNEPALGLHWKCESDTLVYRHREVSYVTLNLRTVYQILATQYDPIGYLVPFSARAKVIIQEIWKTKPSWEDEMPPGPLRDRFLEWESELSSISQVSLPRCMIPSHFETEGLQQQLHIFCDSSERIYGSVAYLRSETQTGDTHVSFVAARSRVAPKKQMSIPRLELCAALTGAQLAETLCNELRLPMNTTVFWSDSSTVLAWLTSESCRYKVYVGTRVSEIQTLTPVENWRYVNTKDNPADDITRGKRLSELCEQSRWRSGPSYLLEPADHWPSTSFSSMPSADEVEVELKATFVASVTVTATPDPRKFDDLRSLIDATITCFDGAANDAPQMDLQEKVIAAEMMLFRKVQEDCFAQELDSLRTGVPVTTTSRLLELAPEYDTSDNIIRVGGRLRMAEEIPENAKHPIVLDPGHPITRLLMKQYDYQLHHYGPERLLAELRRKFWILRGREAVKKFQRQCVNCQKLRNNPKIPKMADLPVARLRLYKPPFYSTGIDCFGPMWVTIGRRREKRWGIIFKCLTTRAVYLDLLENMDTDAFLMSLRRFISLRGKPFEILSDCGTNFKGGEAELNQAFKDMSPNIAKGLSSSQIKFKQNPPYAPHFGGIWEREIRSVKQGLQSILGASTVSETVLRTVLTEVSAILNSKPLGYVSSDIADIDPVTPNSFILGRADISLPQVVYSEDELLSRKRWRQSQILADQFWNVFVRRCGGSGIRNSAISRWEMS